MIIEQFIRDRIIVSWFYVFVLYIFLTLFWINTIYIVCVSFHFIFLVSIGSYLFCISVNMLHQFAWIFKWFAALMRSKSVPWSTLSNSMSQNLRYALELSASTCFVQYSITFAKTLLVTFGKGFQCHQNNSPRS
jgi:hypothetical protein